MKFFLLFLFVSSSVFAQNVWERDEKLNCVQRSFSVDEAQAQLKKKHGKDCEYLRDATRSVIGNIFKCPDGKVIPYFRSQQACEAFFAEGKKGMLSFAPKDHKNPKKWVEIFGTCMETATQKQLNSMGIQTLNTFCGCVAEKTKDKITGFIVKDCSKGL